MSSGSKVASLTAILALTSVARGAEINDDTDGQSSKSLEKEYQSYDANTRYTKAQQEQYHHHSTTRQRRIANNKQRRLINRRRSRQHTNKQKQSHRQAQFASTSQRPQQSNTATSQTNSPQSNTQTTSVQSTQLAAPKCGPTSGTYHSPYIGCYTDKLNDRIMSFELPNKYHSVLTCEKICSDKGYRYIGREFKGQCFCHNGSNVNDIIRHGVETDCDCCGANVGGGKICVWENANHPDSQATPPVITPVVPSLIQSANEQDMSLIDVPVHSNIFTTNTNANNNNQVSVPPRPSYTNNRPPPNQVANNNKPPNNNINKPKPTGGFRIRLHWQRGYNWQNSRTEKFYCMQCRGSCKSGSSIEINTCKGGNYIRQKFLAIGHTIRPASNPSLCITVTGYNGKSSPTRLQYCKRNTNGSGRGQGGRYASNQSFSEVSASGKFELLTDDRSGRCLSQHHHPKPGEVVYPEKCEKTRRYDTTYWRTW